MSFSKLHSAQISFLTAHIIDIEVDIAHGLHSFSIVGLADRAVEEARDRVSSAIKNSGFTSPKQKNQKVVISLAPADVRKEGPVFDLAIALAYLHAAGDIVFNPEKKIFFGELSLDGSVRAVSGILPLVQGAHEHGFTEIFVPADNAREAALIHNVRVFAVTTLRDVVAHLQHHTLLTPQPHTIIEGVVHETENDFADIRGHEHAKRGLEIAAAGGHSVAMIGPPGTGKTMLAHAFRSILPPLSFSDILEVTAIHSVAGVLRDTLITHVPMRAPHHTASYTSLIGGGSIPKPGDITLAHRGILFLDEFPEFDRRVIDSLRQPLEEHVVSISRAKGSARFPADVILVAAMNPCPCGFRGVVGKQCVCSPTHIASYTRKISGPIVDRIDVWLSVETVKHDVLSGVATGEQSSEVRARVARARQTQAHRAQTHKLTTRTNSRIGAKQLPHTSPLSPEVKHVLDTAAERLNMSARAYHRVWKIAQTIADLAQSRDIKPEHALEALQYRPRFSAH